MIKLPIRLETEPDWQQCLSDAIARRNELQSLAEQECRQDASYLGVILTVEYKGTDRWLAAEEDRLIGGLWEALSGGRCRFVMIKDRNWAGIEEKL